MHQLFAWEGSIRPAPHSSLIHSMTIRGLGSLGSTGTSCVLPSSFFMPMGMADSGTAGATEMGARERGVQYVELSLAELR